MKQLSKVSTRWTDQGGYDEGRSGKQNDVHDPEYGFVSHAHKNKLSVSKFDSITWSPMTNCWLCCKDTIQWDRGIEAIESGLSHQLVINSHSPWIFGKLLCDVSNWGISTAGKIMITDNSIDHIFKSTEIITLIMSFLEEAGLTIHSRKENTKNTSKPTWSRTCKNCSGQYGR